MKPSATPGIDQHIRESRKRMQRKIAERIYNVRYRVSEAEFDAGGGMMSQEDEDCWHLLYEIDRLKNIIRRHNATIRRLKAKP